MAFCLKMLIFAERVEQSGFIFIGPDPKTIQMMGDKLSAISLVKKSGIPCVPGSETALSDDTQANQALATKLGYPVLIKASGGGGGRGMRVVSDPMNLSAAIMLTRQEALAAFGSDVVYMEKFLARPRHIEFQIFGDGFGNAIHLGERDCSLQRRHQKIVEEAPAPGLSTLERARMGQLVTDFCKSIRYRGAGTFEFLYEQGKFYFIEMNTRIQVEHPVTEMITGVDLVTMQLALALGKKVELEQKKIVLSGHAIEVRLNAEDPFNFMPSPGNIDLYHPPGGPGVRIETHLYSGYTVPSDYDSMIGKLIVWGQSRADAITRMRHALDEIVIDGIRTNVPLHQKILNDPEFVSGPVSIHHLENIFK